MKSVRLLIVACLMTGAFSVQNAISQTVAYVSTEEIFLRLPKAVEARARLGESQSKWTQEIRDAEKAVTTLRNEIEKNRLLWSAQERTRKEGELRDMEASLSSLRAKKFGPNGEFEVLYRDLMQPVIDIVVVAVRAEAESQKYDYVFDKSSRGLPMLFANPEHDLTFDVLKRLGVEVDESELKVKTEKPFQILPESLPVQIGGDRFGRPTQAPAQNPNEKSNETMTPSQVENPNQYLEETKND